MQLVAKRLLLHFVKCDMIAPKFLVAMKLVRSSVQKDEISSNG